MDPAAHLSDVVQKIENKAEKAVKTGKNAKSAVAPTSVQFPKAGGSKWCSTCRKDNHNTEDCYRNVKGGKGGPKSDGQGKAKGTK